MVGLAAVCSLCFSRSLFTAFEEEVSQWYAAVFAKQLCRIFGKILSIPGSYFLTPILDHIEQNNSVRDLYVQLPEQFRANQKLSKCLLNSDKHEASATSREVCCSLTTLTIKNLSLHTFWTSPGTSSCSFHMSCHWFPERSSPSSFPLEGEYSLKLKLKFKVSSVYSPNWAQKNRWFFFFLSQKIWHWNYSKEGKRSGDRSQHLYSTFSVLSVSFGEQ